MVLSLGSRLFRVSICSCMVAELILGTNAVRDDFAGMDRQRRMEKLGLLGRFVM